MKLKPVPIALASHKILDHISDLRPCYSWGLDGITNDLTTGPGHLCVIGAKTGVGRSIDGPQRASHRLHIVGDVCRKFGRALLSTDGNDGGASPS